MDTRASDTASGARLTGPAGRPAPRNSRGPNQIRKRFCDFKKLTPLARRLPRTKFLSRARSKGGQMSGRRKAPPRKRPTPSPNSRHWIDHRLIGEALDGQNVSGCRRGTRFRVLESHFATDWSIAFRAPRWRAQRAGGGGEPARASLISS